MGNIPISPASLSVMRDIVRKQAVNGSSGKPIKPQILQKEKNMDIDWDQSVAGIQLAQVRDILRYLSLCEFNNRHLSETSIW